MRRRTAVIALAAIATGTFAGPASGAESLYATTSDGRLINFASDAPAVVLSANRIRGLPAGEAIEAIDFRPANGRLYGLGRSSRLYTIDTRTAAAAPVAAEAFDPALNGRSFGFDFNPVADRIRVVSDAEQNLRLNPDDGKVAGTDRPLMYDAARVSTDLHDYAISEPAIVGSAYTNSRPGATETRLYGIDAANDWIVVQDPPNDGTLRRTAHFPANVPATLGFDISSDGAAYAAFTGPSGRAELYDVDLTGGNSSANRPGNPRVIGDGAEVVGLAAAGQIPDDRTGPRVLLDAARRVSKSSLRRAGLGIGVSCSEACELEARLTRNGVRLGTATARLAQPDVARLQVRLTKAGRRAIAGRRRRGLVLELTARDATGNRTRLRRGVVAR